MAKVEKWQEREERPRNRRTLKGVLLSASSAGKVPGTTLAKGHTRKPSVRLTHIKRAKLNYSVLFTDAKAEKGFMTLEIANVER